ncbi:S41 family peptidase, partial [Acidobacteriia bacterium AH_259_A11_L15]|nr:S41 family peptidase [Acidobacteriia bacterium AH_259_A11_L15]
GPQFYVGSLTLLHSVGATDSTDAAVLTLSTADGGEKTVEVAGGNFEIRRKLCPSTAAVGKVPIYLSQVDTNYWLKPLPDHSALYFQFNQVRDAEGEKITEFAQRLWARLASRNIDNVIVDVRHNNGGNNSLVRPLVRVLVAFEMASPEHRIFVITGRNTFSAAQNFINHVERWTNAVFVGEPSSSRPNSIGEETNLRLPYSRILGSISTRFWQDSDPGDERAWISPDIPVVLSAGDYFSNRDPALEAILEILAPDSK